MKPRRHRLASPFATIAFLALILAAPARATWSILIVDTATGEVAVGIATCLTGFDLRPNTVVVVPGVGVGAAQSFVGPLSLRQLIRNELIAGTTPTQILNLLAAADTGHQSRQYGIVDAVGGAATFTGTGAFAFANGVTGNVGSIYYAVQGNVLTGQPVITMAEQAIANTVGDVGQKLMAAMEAARAMGGDGRCSCGANPTGCGSPPPAFTKSSHIGLVIVSRPGDLDAPCTGSSGCGAGDYYLDINIANQQAADPDPVLQIQALYDAWRIQQAGRPDHFRSTASLAATDLRANGVDSTTASVVLRDIDGLPIGNAATLSVSLDSTSTADATFGAVVAQPDGSYTFDVTAGVQPGEIVLNVVADDGQGTVLLSPRPVIQVGDPFGACGVGTVNSGPNVVDVLRVDGEVGSDRVVTVPFGQPFSIDVAAPPVGGGLAGNFLLWAHLGVPTPSSEFAFGVPTGSLCFTPVPFDPFAPTLLLADSIGAGALYGATSAPWSVAIPGIPSAVDLVLQGLMVESATELGVTNAVVARVELFPPPVITDVFPDAAPAGATVSVQGTGFEPGVTAVVGATPAITQFVSPDLVTFTMPAGAGCDTSLSIQNPGSLSATAYLNATPGIFSTPFSSGPSAGGVLYLVTGENLEDATLTIGGAAATINSTSPNSILALTPPGVPGPATVVVTSPAGCTATTTYTYQ